MGYDGRKSVSVLPGSDTSGVAIRRAGVPTELDALEKELSILDECSTRLSGKLQPVRNQRPETGGDKVQAAPPATSEVQALIHAAVMRVVSIRVRLDALYEEIDL